MESRHCLETDASLCSCGFYGLDALVPASGGSRVSTVHSVSSPKLCRHELERFAALILNHLTDFTLCQKPDVGLGFRV